MAELLCPDLCSHREHGSATSADPAASRLMHPASGSRRHDNQRAAHTWRAPCSSLTHARARAMLVARGGAGRPPCAMPPRCRSVGIGDSLSEREPSSFTFDSYRCTFVLRFVLLYFRTALRIYLLTPLQKKGGCRLALGCTSFSSQGGRGR